MARSQAVSTAQVGAAPFFAGKNAIINGDFRINQRGFTSNTASDAFNFDRWQQFNNGGTVTVTPQTFTAGAAPVAGYEAVNFVRMVTASQSAAGDYAILYQKIEDVRTFANQTVTVSFWAKAASGTPKVTAEFSQLFGSGGSSNVNTYIGQVTLSTSWARYSVTVSNPSISGKTIGTGSSLALNLWVSAGTNLNSRTNSLGVQNNTFDFWGVQVESGSVPTAFQTATGTIQGELAACQRYYFRNTGTTYYAHGLGNIYSTTIGSFFIQPPVPMRIAPSAVEFSTLAISEQGTLIAATNITIVGAASNGIIIDATASGLTANRWAYLQNNNNTAGYLAFTAEL